MHKADIGIRLDNAGPRAAMLLAASRGNMDGYKTALVQSYGSVAAKRIYESIIDAIYEYALREAGKRMGTTEPAEEATLEFWTTVVLNYEDRHVME